MIIRNLAKSIILSIILPGLGQLYFNKIILSIITIGLYLVSFELIIYFNILSIYEGFSLLTVITVLFIGISLCISIINSIRLRNVIINHYKWYYFLIIIIIFYSTIIVSFISLSDLRGYHPLSASMEPTIAIKDYFIVSTKYYSQNEIERGDILVFNPPKGEIEKLYVKRCIALPGDSFKIANNMIYLNNKILEEPYVIGKTSYESFSQPQNIEGIVPNNCIIVLGDNRKESLDSRFFGFVPIERIKGKALYIYKSDKSENIGKRL